MNHVLDTMSRSITFCLVLFCTLDMSAQNWTLEDVSRFDNFDDFEHLLHLEEGNNSDTTYLINFWATWCKPCVAELPYIEALVDTYKDKKYRSILVSLDFKHQIESKFIPFLNKNKIKSEVALLLDTKESRWIDKVDPQWSGAIPITLIYNKEKRIFLEKSFHSEEELTELIDPIIK